jgi:hypothetical protein
MNCGLRIGDRPQARAGCTNKANLPAGAGVRCTNGPNSCHYADPEIGVPGGVNRAKRTQFAADGRRTPSSRPKALAMPPVTGARARNKANSSPGPGGGGSETCETNPIWLVGRRPGKGNAQNEPNSPAAPAGTRLGGRGVLYKQTQLLRYADPEIGVPGRAILRNKANRLEPIVRNKPNLVRRAGPRRGETCETKPNLSRMGHLGNGASGR